jgi:hypothetical protein
VRAAGPLGRQPRLGTELFVRCHLVRLLSAARAYESSASLNWPPTLKSLTNVTVSLSLQKSSGACLFLLDIPKRLGNNLCMVNANNINTAKETTMTKMTKLTGTKMNGTEIATVVIYRDERTVWESIRLMHECGYLVSVESGYEVAR